MIDPKRAFVVTALIALFALGNVAADSRSGLRDARAPRHRPHIAPPPATEFGAPYYELTPSQLVDFNAGLDEFTSEDTAESGLGPGFNNVSCVACHSVPAPGGGS